MNSKSDRLNSSIENINEAIKYYLKYAENKYYLHEISRNDYIKLTKNLKELNDILSNLKIFKPIEIKKLDEIRRINLSIMSLYEEGDYNTIFAEIIKTNNNICHAYKEKDRKKLGDFKRIFNSLSNFYQYRLKKAEKTVSGNLGYRDKGLDNVKFILENYLSIKYNFKKIKYENANISNIDQYRINEYTKIIESSEYNSSVKDKYLNITNYITKYASAEVIINNLKKIIQLCDELEYSNIKRQTQIIMNKYQKIYADNKGKYDSEIPKSNDKTTNITEDHISKTKKDINELEALLHSITLAQLKNENNEVLLDSDKQEPNSIKR